MCCRPCSRLFAHAIRRSSCGSTIGLLPRWPPAWPVARSIWVCCRCPCPRSFASRASRPTELLRLEVLASQEDVLICPPNHPFASRRALELAGSGGRADGDARSQHGESRAVRRAHGSALRCEPHVVMEMSSVEVLKRLVELGFGLSIVPAFRGATRMRARKLARSSPEGTPYASDWPSHAHQGATVPRGPRLRGGCCKAEARAL